MDTVIQWLEEAETAEEAEEIAGHMLTQDGVFAYRVLEPAPSKPTYRVQSFAFAAGHQLGDRLPDGLRVVLLPDSLRASLIFRV